jgi:choline dehydrogenase-like flavoprotein
VIEYLTQESLHKGSNTDICIVGAGAAGISLCIALARKGHQVTLVDGGGFDESDANEDAYRGHASAPHPDTTEYRRQRLGGTTHLWGGRCVPFDKHDFEKRSHVPLSGWPIAKDQLVSYLESAQEICDAGVYDYSVASLTDSSPMFTALPKLAPDLEECIERYSLPTDFANKYREELENSDNICVLLKARCTELHLDDASDTVTSISLSNGDDVFELKASRFILCGGGVETTRLLLLAQRNNQNLQKLEALGKYYACHYDLIFGELKFTHEKPKFNFQKTKDGIYARRKLQFSSDFQNRHGLLNTTFRLHFPAYSDASHRSGVLSLIYLAKSILPGEHQAILDHGKQHHTSSTAAHILNVFRDCFSIVRFSFDWLFKIKLAKRKLPYTLETNSRGTYPLELNSEQIPHPDNSISLNQDLDDFGMPRVTINWKMRDEDIRSGLTNFEKLKNTLASCDNCELLYDESQLQSAMQQALPIGGHHLGTTRMGESTDTSVVDKNCQVHGVGNLFVASSSIFTSSGHANPTLLIVAFALRLADHLDQTNPSRER